MVIAGGGTGGHLFPGVAVARAVVAQDPGAVVTFAGTAQGIEARVLPREGLTLDVIRSAGLKGKSVGALLRGLGLVPVSALDAWQVLSRRMPDVVVGVGGYSSGPVVGLAALRRIPTMVLEQNAMPGLANRMLAKVVEAAALTYDEARPWFGERAFLSGNPVRDGFRAIDPAAPRREGPPRLLVFGGSQGAQAINAAMVAGAARLKAAGIVVTHQTGERDLATVREAYAHAGLDARVEPFLHAMDREMADADLVVARAGATTIAELTVAGRAALLVPLPTATDDHQRKNAEALARRGAVEVLLQSAIGGTALADRIVALLGDAPRLQQMRQAARAAGRPDAADVIAARILALARRN